MSADTGKMGDIVQRAIKAVGRDNAGFRILQVANELKEGFFLRMIVKIIDNSINNDIRKSVMKILNSQLMIGLGAGLTMYHGVIVLRIIRNAVDGAVRSQNTIAILSFEIGKAGHECVEKELKCRGANQLATHDKGVLGRQIGIRVQDAKGFRKLTSDSTAAKAENSFNHGAEIQSAGSGKVGFRMNAVLGTILNKYLNGI